MINPIARDIIEELETKGEVKTCKCGTKFWIYWYEWGRNQTKNMKIKEMSECAPCFFKHERKNI